MRSWLRHLLGIDHIAQIVNHLHYHAHLQEAIMATASEQLSELKNAFTDFSSDVNAKLDQLVAAQGNLNPDAQAVFDELKAAVLDADARVGDADGSDAPAEPQPSVPTPPPVQ